MFSIDTLTYNYNHDFISSFWWYGALSEKYVNYLKSSQKFVLLLKNKVYLNYGFVITYRSS